MMQSLVFVIDFFLLGMLSYYIRQRYIREGYFPTATALSVMTLCLFALSAMQFLPASLRVLTPYLFLEFLVIWLLITESFLKCFLEGHFYIHTRNMLNRFNIGTWVIASSFLTILAIRNFPDWNEIIWLLGIVSVAIWIEYTRLFINDLIVLSRRRVNLKINGSIFLGSMSIQSIVLLLNVMLPEYFPQQLSLLLLSIGYLFYVWCTVLLIRCFLRNHLHHFISDWSSVNTYLYGALAISGLAALRTGVVPAEIIVATCIVAMLLFVVTECISLYKLTQKSIHEKRYDPTQWSRLFSLNALFLLIVLLKPFQMHGFENLIYVLTHYVQYVIAALVVWEVGKFFKANIKPPLNKSPIFSFKKQS